VATSAQHQTLSDWHRLRKAGTHHAVQQAGHARQLQAFGAKLVYLHVLVLYRLGLNAMSGSTAGLARTCRITYGARDGAAMELADLTSTFFNSKLWLNVGALINIF
jgi:hypothetical protein